MHVKITKKNIYIILCALIVVLGGILRFYYLPHKQFSATELLTVKFIKLDFLDMVFERVRVAHSPLYCIILYFINKVFGLSELSLRIFSALLGTCSVYVFFEIGRLLVNRRTALLSTLFFALSRNHIFYSQWARANAACSFFVLLSVLFWVKALKKGKKIYWIWYIICSVIAIYFHNFAFLVIVAQGVYFLIFLKGANNFKNFCKSSLIIYLSILPLVITFLILGPETAKDPVINNFYVAQAPLLNLDILKLFFLKFGRSYIRLPLINIKILLFPVFSLAGIAFLWINKRWFMMQRGKIDEQACLQFFIPFWMLVPVFLIYGTSLVWQPIFDDSYLLP